MQPYQEAIELYQRADDRLGEATAAYNLGHAYNHVPALRDLDQAEQLYQRYLELLGENDTHGRAQGTGQLGDVAYERFKEARTAGAPSEQLLRHLNEAAGAYSQALGLFPADAIGELAASHHSLGNIYSAAGDIATALGHLQKAIAYRERQDDRYGAGWARAAAANTLAQAGRRHDALLYARAALRDLEAVGPGAAALASEVRQLITQLEQEPPDDQDPNPAALPDSDGRPGPRPFGWRR